MRFYEHWSFYSLGREYWQAYTPEVEPVLTLPPRPVDAYGTNPLNPGWGSTGSDLLRLAADDRGPNGEMSGADRPGAREISNAVNDQHGADIPNAAGASDFLWMWGQFIDHDMSLTEAGHTQAAAILVPLGDPDFDPMGTGTATIPFTRVDPTPTGYQNQITGFLDASMIYGSDAETLGRMRVDGGKLLMTEDAYLHLEGTSVFTGDTRAAENVALMSMHTLFTREHNRIVAELAQRDPSLGADELFDAARARVEALVQAVTFNEFLPLLLGEDALGDYAGHDPMVNPQVSVEFSTAVYRLGHTLLSSQLQLVAEDGASDGELALRDAFFSPSFVGEHGIEPILRGAATQTAQKLDTLVVEDVRSFLFGAPGAGGLDLASLNIQRGRDLGMASYVDLREAMGLDPVTSFDQITSDTGLAARLEAVYGDVGLVDAWVGGLAEDHVAGGMVGETFAAVLVDQFTRLRAGDPMWSEVRGFSQAELDELWSTRLSDIIVRNSDIDAMQTNVFQAMTRIVGEGTDDLMPGTERADFMLGQAGDDIMGGFDGDDELRGGEGNDVLYGLAGDDLLWGEAGEDVLQGADGNDTMHGGDAHDVLYGDYRHLPQGDDVLFGEGGSDFLIGHGGNDLLVGGEGDDLLLGGAGNDTLLGGDGEDVLYGDSGEDVLCGGAGPDRFYFDARSTERTVVLDFDPHEDSLHFSNVNLSLVRLTTGEDGLVLTLDLNTDVVFADWGSDTVSYLLDLMA